MYEMIFELAGARIPFEYPININTDEGTQNSKVGNILNIVEILT
jgi:hypothetical protein